MDAMNILRNDQQYSTSDFKQDFPQFKHEPNIYTKQRIGQLSADMGVLHFPDALQYAKEYGAIFKGVMTIPSPYKGLKSVIPYIGRGGVLSSVYTRYKQAQPDMNFTPRQYIKIAGDYIYDQ